MVVITKLIMLGIVIVCLVTLVFIILDFVADKVKSKFSKKRNKVKFYVSMDRDCSLWLYIGKPTKIKDDFMAGYQCRAIAGEDCFSEFGLDANDYVNLKWEDEPLEVFLNMED